jgi:hypothetical protein
MATAATSPSTFQRIAPSSLSIRKRRSCHHAVLLNPSNATDPSITARNATVPGGSGARATWSSGLRRPSLPSRSVTGARRANSPKYTVNASPFGSHASRPNAAIPTHVTQL